MSRFEESQFPAMQEHLESLERSRWHLQHEVDQIRRTNDVIKEVRVVDLIFDPTKCGKGVEEINRYLERGFEVFKQFHSDQNPV